MSEETKPASGAAVGADGVNSTEPKAEPKPKKSVAWEDHQRALDDMHKFKRDKEEADKRLAQVEEKRLRDNEDWKTLAEREKQRAEKLEADNKKLSDVFTRTQKYSEIKKAAVESGLRIEAMDDLDLIDVDGVQVEATSSGRFIVHGAKEFVEELKVKKPHWFKKGSPSEVNAGNGGAAPQKPKKITATDLYNAEKKMKSGMISKDDYTKLYKEYLGQPKH